MLLLKTHDHTKEENTSIAFSKHGQKVWIRKKRIIYRTALMVSSIATFTVLVMAATIFPFQRAKLIDDMMERSRIIYRSIDPVVEDAVFLDDFSLIVEHCMKLISENKSLKYVVLVRKDGFSIVHTENGWQQKYLGGMWLPEKNIKMFPKESGTFIKTNLINERVHHTTYPLILSGIEWGYLHLGYSIRKYKEEMTGLYVRIFIAALLALSAGGIMSFLFARKISIPIKRLEHFAETIAEGKLHGRISVKTGDEMENLGDKLNYMVSELERFRIESAIAQKKMLESARKAGMAEMAVDVLHNVGNVLNSVGTSASISLSMVRESRANALTPLIKLIKEHLDDFSDFVAHDPKGARLPEYLTALFDAMLKEREDLLISMRNLEKHIAHMKDIIHLQQDYSKSEGISEYMHISEVIEDVLALSVNSLEKNGITIEKHFEAIPMSLIDRQKILQILTNMISNAKNALLESDTIDKRLRIFLKKPRKDMILIEVKDNGIGILPENLISIFRHGFTTRKAGHGFGLHYSAVSAAEMKGSLYVKSSGFNKGASFFLELPFRPKEDTHEHIE